MFRKFINYIPLLNFCISTTAIFLQTRISYSWHNELSNDIDKLYINIDKINREINEKEYK